MNVLTIAELLVMTLSGTFGALFFKRASASMENKNLFAMLGNVNLYIGGCFYLLGAVLNVLLLRRLDYSVVYPMTSLTYIWTLLVSRLLLGEKITAGKVIALVLILSGVITINL